MGKQQSDYTEIGISYEGSSDLSSTGDSARMQLYSNIHRDVMCLRIERRIMRIVECGMPLLI